MYSELEERYTTMPYDEQVTVLANLWSITKTSQAQEGKLVAELQVTQRFDVARELGTLRADLAGLLATIARLELVTRTAPQDV